ncbi:MAG: hypothetical protein RLZZ502_456 [Pseudomonadota bacterium]|jgi:redox-sensitive bicupin YhaK (pirin superfamily)
MKLSPLHDEPLVIGSGFRAHGLRASTEALDPLLMIDHFYMSAPTFGPHPHAGFSAVTYLFADSSTGVRSRDSSGDDSLIHPGDAHWMVAGRGMVHDEMPQVFGKVVHGLQLFVRLAAKDQFCAPHPLKIRRAQMPRPQQGHHQITVAWGQYDDGVQQSRCPVAVPTPHTLLDIKLAADAPFVYPLPRGQHNILLLIEGAAEVNGHAMQAPQACTAEGDSLELRTTTAAQVVLLMGMPLREPVFQHGPFALGTRAQVVQAIHDYQAGKMGHLESIHTEASK